MISKKLAVFILGSLFYFLWSWLYFGRLNPLAAQDDLNLLNPSTFELGFFKSLWNYYIEASGRIGEFGSFIAWNRLNHFLYSGSIFNYPWWFFKCLACLTYSLAGLGFLSLSLQIAKPKDTLTFVCVSFFAWTALALNPLIPNTLLEIGTLLPAYALGMLMLSLIAHRFLRRQSFDLGIFLPIYFFCLLAHEQVFLATSALVFSLILFQLLSQVSSWSQFKRNLLLYTVIHLSAAGLILLSPGEHNKIKIAGGSVLSFTRFIQQFCLSFSDLLPFSHGLSKFVFIVPAAISLIWFIDKTMRNRKSLAELLSLDSGRRAYWIIAFFASGCAACLTAGVSKYFPERAHLTPLLCFSASLWITLIVLFDEIKVRLGKEWHLVSVVALAVISLTLLHHHLGIALPIWSKIAAVDTLRRETYQKIDQLSHANPHSTIHVSYCPPVFDAFWGIGSFVRWQKIPHTTQLSIDGLNYENGQPFFTGQSIEMDCALRFPEFVVNPEDQVVQNPALILVDNFKSSEMMRSHVRAYFPIRGDTKYCQGTVTYQEYLTNGTRSVQTQSFETTLDRRIEKGLSHYEPRLTTVAKNIQVEMVSPEGTKSPFYSPEIDTPFMIKTVRRSQTLAGFLQVQLSNIDATKDFLEFKLKCGL